MTCYILIFKSVKKLLLELKLIRVYNVDNYQMYKFMYSIKVVYVGVNFSNRGIFNPVTPF